LHEKEIELIQNNERLKGDYDKKLRTIQKEIDQCDDYRNRMNELELKLKSIIFFSFKRRKQI